MYTLRFALWRGNDTFLRMANVALDDLRALMAEACMLQDDPATIDEDKPLFGPDSIGLDSIDALELSLAVEKKYGTPLKDPELARQVLKNLGSLKEWLEKQPGLKA